MGPLSTHNRGKVFQNRLDSRTANLQARSESNGGEHLIRPRLTQFQLKEQPDFTGVFNSFARCFFNARLLLVQRSSGEESGEDLGEKLSRGGLFEFRSAL
jgi:hypothetical protein